MSLNAKIMSASVKQVHMFALRHVPIAHFRSLPEIFLIRPDWLFVSFQS